MIGPEALYDGAYRALVHAIPDLERRDYIVMAGQGGQQLVHHSSLLAGDEAKSRIG